MGKVSILNRNSEKVMQKHSVKKTASRASQKRILILRRRLSALLDEKESWETKNQELIDSFNKERKSNSELQKQVFNWQRLYHEAIISLNTYKVNHAGTMQNITSCLKDINLAFPHLVGLSDVMCRNKVRLTSQLNSLRTSETENYLPRAFGDSGQMDNDLSNEREKRRKHKVGPMVKGVLIQKPTIRLERVMLHQPQSQEPANSDFLPTGANTLSPINEENEGETNSHLRRGRKHRLGSGERWRLRKQEQLEKERQIERERKRESQCSSVAEESSDSDNQLGPVIRLQRVSGLLLSPNLLEVERGRATEGKGATSRTSEPETHRLRAGDDPMEGCSWMNINLKHTINKKDPGEGKTQSPVTSDSSDEESDPLNVVQENMCSNLKNSLYRSQTFTVCRKSSGSSSSGDLSQEASDFSRPEPDSTSNIVFARASSSTRDSLGNSSSASSVPAHKQLAYFDTTSGVNRSQQERRSCGSDIQTSSGVTPLAATEHVRPSQDQRRSSGFCNNCTLIGSPSDVQEKRIRKPKIHLYPGEESNNPKTVACKAKKGKPVMKSSKVSISLLSTGRKSLGKSSRKKSLEPSRGSSAPASAVADRRASQDKPGGSNQKKKAPKKSSLKKCLEPSRGSSAPSSAVADRRASQDKPGGSNQKKKAPKKSSVKKSLETPRNSAISLDQSTSQGERDRRGSRRARGPVSYKESPLNMKMRRPT